MVNRQFRCLMDQLNGPQDFRHAYAQHTGRRSVCRPSLGLSRLSPSEKPTQESGHSRTCRILLTEGRLGAARPRGARSREVLRWRAARRPDDLAWLCERRLGELRIRDYLSHAAGEQVRPRSPCLQRSLLAFSSDIGILKSGRGSKDFERTLGHPRTTQVEGCRSHAQKALSQSQSDA